MSDYAVMLLIISIAYFLFYGAGLFIQEIPKKNKRDTDWRKQGSVLKKVTVGVLWGATAFCAMMVASNPDAVAALWNVQLLVGLGGFALMLICLLLGAIGIAINRIAKVGSVIMSIAFALMESLQWFAVASVICSIFK